ncbi:MAG: Gfo/Idh/MocA family oxidoreductase [Planctomycetaceae bacterium]|nr:Gfo/Idh/MocA family oxidoreductase [Planctomycetaceae bacterium]
MSQSICRWGILSTAGIAKKNWHSIALSENAAVTAVASRSVEKAEAFIRECQASAPVPGEIAALGSYDELLARTDVDAVYIPLPTGLRTEWVVKAAEAGKHVMVEKPVGVTANDVRAMIQACDKAGVQLMDGVMFMHSSRMQAMRDALDDPNQIGEIRRITSLFSFCADDAWVNSNIRASSSLEPAGCLGDLGWYTIRITLWAMKYELPVEVRGRILFGAKRPDSPDDVPMEFQGEMHFRNGTSATFFNSFRTHHTQLVNVSGSKGYLQMNDFVLPYYGNNVEFEVASHQFVADGCRFSMERHSRTTSLPEYSNNARTAQETNLFRTFSQLVVEGRRDSFWPEVALKTQLVLDAALKSARNNGQPIDPMA